MIALLKKCGSKKKTHKIIRECKLSDFFVLAEAQIDLRFFRWLMPTQKKACTGANGGKIAVMYLNIR